MGCCDGASMGPAWGGSWTAASRTGCPTRSIPVTAPTLVVGGEHSPVLAPHAAEQMVARLARGQLAEIPGAGHDLGVEQPERVAAVVRDFLLAPRYGVT